MTTDDHAAFHAPVYVTRFIGRTRELEALSQVVTRGLRRGEEAARSSPSARLLTLVGAGGSGKTRLAAELSIRTRPIEADARSAPLSSWWVDLAQVSDADALRHAVASALGLRDAAEDLVGALIRVLGSEPSVLILDNCEQVAHECALLLGRLLPACPHTMVVATSRTPLGAPGEQVFPVPPLATTARDSTTAEDVGSTSEAIHLFLDRAGMVMPGYRLLGENIQAVDTLCRRLDGSPLAIELAASWMRVLSARELLAEVDRNLESLNSFTPFVAPRHRSIRAVLDNSWQLLSAQERQVLRRLSVFVGTFSHAAAAAVAAADLPSLLSLAEKSLIHREPETASGTRFRLHEVVRTFAAECLAADGPESDEVHRRFFDYMVEVARRAEAGDGALDAGHLNRLHHEQANLKSALEWAVDRQDPRRALRLAAALWGFLAYALPVPIYTAAVERALALPWDTDDELITADRAMALYVAGFGAVFGSNLRQARHRFAEAVSQYRQLGDERMVAKCLQGGSYSLTLAGRPDEAERLEAQALEILGRLGDQQGLAWSMHDIGEIAFARGDLDRAQRYLTEGWRRFERAGIAYGSYRAQSLLGDVYRLKGNWSEALACYGRALQEQQRLSLVTGGAEILEGLAQIAALLREPACAARLFGSGRAWLQTYGLRRFYFYEREHRRCLALAHAQMTDDGWLSNYTSGQRLTSDQAVEDAVRAAAELLAVAAARAASRLTRRQVEIVRLVAEGRSNLQIAEQLVVSPRTVDAHLRSVFVRLGVGTRTAAVHEAIRLDLIG